MARPVVTSLLGLTVALATACDAPVTKQQAVLAESTVARAPFDTSPDRKPVELFTLTNSVGMEVRAMSYGATILSIKVPDAHGALDNVVLGFDSLAGYLRHSPGLGAVVGRGFDREVWSPEPLQNDSSIGVAYNFTSHSGDPAFSGTLTVRVTYTLSKTRNELRIEYEGSTDQATPVNLTNHTWFILAGTAKAESPAGVLTLDADTTTGAPSARAHTFIVNRKGPGLVHVAHLADATTGRTLDVSTTEPGVEIATGERHAILVAPQRVADSPGTTLKPGAVYRSQTVFSFGVIK